MLGYFEAYDAKDNDFLGFSLNNKCYFIALYKLDEPLIIVDCILGEYEVNESDKRLTFLKAKLNNKVLNLNKKEIEEVISMYDNIYLRWHNIEDDNLEIEYSIYEPEIYSFDAPSNISPKAMNLASNDTLTVYASIASQDIINAYVEIKSGWQPADGVSITKCLCGQINQQYSFLATYSTRSSSCGPCICQRCIGSTGPSSFSSFIWKNAYVDDSSSSYIYCYFLKTSTLVGSRRSAQYYRFTIPISSNIKSYANNYVTYNGNNASYITYNGSNVNQIILNDTNVTYFKTRLVTGSSYKADTNSIDLGVGVSFGIPFACNVYVMAVDYFGSTRDISTNNLKTLSPNITYMRSLHHSYANINSGESGQLYYTMVLTSSSAYYNIPANAYIGYDSSYDTYSYTDSGGGTTSYTVNEISAVGNATEVDGDFYVYEN